MTGSGAAPQDLPLPELRADLELLPGATGADGQPSWLIHDPVMNRFTQLEPAAREALKYWRDCASVGELVQRVNADSPIELDVQSVVTLIDFLYASQLTTMPKAGGWRGFVRSKAAAKHSLPAWLIHNYLFLRVPLVKPQALLERSLPIARLLWSRAVRGLIALMGVFGLYLASRQWELFVGTLLSYFTWEGMITGALALGLVKLAHELGHAYAAVAFGCRVHTMGIAFVVMAPMPYTDVTDAWRLIDRRKRLLIDGAGMITEAGIAAIALFVWGLLPDGPARSAAFVLSAVSLLSSLAINLNPFMRFDGYYLLSEFLEIENLQSRAFALGRWRLRELLFAPGFSCPERISATRMRLLVIYAWSIWIYRLFVFTGIALLVYHYFFKILGILLFGVEIVYFVAGPIITEMSVWWKMRSSLLTTRRGQFTLAAAALGTVASFVPWSTTVEIPAVIEASQVQSIYPAQNARVVSVAVKHGATVKAGDAIATLTSSDVDDEMRRTKISLQIAELQYGRRVADAADREGSLIIESTIETLRAKVAGLHKERSELTIIAPFDGKIVELNPELQPGRWVSPRDLIAIVAGGHSLVAKGYAAEADIGRLTVGAQARFIPEHPSRAKVDLHVTQVATAGAIQIEISDLASVNSGRIAVNLDERRRLIPVAAQYLVTLAAESPATNTDLAVRGIVIAQGRSESLLSRSWRRAVGILVRESGA